MRLKSSPLALILFTIVSFSVCSRAFAGDIRKGEELYRFVAFVKNHDLANYMPTQEEFVLDGKGTSYVTGVLDGIKFSENGFKLSLPFKLPEHVTNMEIFLIIEKHFSKHPEDMHLPSWVIIIQSLKDAYPNPDYKAPNK